MSKTLKQLGKDFFLTEFNVNNPTNSPIDFELFNSNSNINTPTIPIYPPPTQLQGIIPSSLPFSAALCPINNFYYVLDSLSFSVRIIDCSVPSGVVIGNISLPSQPLYINYCPNNNQMYIGLAATYANTQLGGILRIDCATNTLTGGCNVTNTNPTPNGQPSISVAAGFFTNGSVLEYCPTNNTIWATHVAGGIFLGQIQVFSESTNTLITTIPTIFGSTVNIIKYNPNNNRMYITYQFGYLRVIDCATFADVTTPINIPEIPTYLAFKLSDNTLFIATDNVPAIIKVFDCNTNTITSTINLPFAQEVRGITYNSITDELFGVITALAIVFKIDVATTTISSQSIGILPQSIEFCLKENQVYVGDTFSPTIYIVFPNLFFSIINLTGTGAVYTLKYNLLNNIMYALVQDPTRRLITITCDFPLGLNIQFSQVVSSFGVGFTLPCGLGYNSINNNLYFTNASTNQIEKYGNSTTFNNAIYNSNDNSFYYLNSDTYGINLITKLDCSTNSIVNVFSFLSNQSSKISLNKNSNIIYAGDITNINLFDCNTNSFISQIPMPLGAFGGDSVYCPTNNSVYIASVINNNVAILNCTTNTFSPILTYLAGTSSIDIEYNSVNNLIYIVSDTDIIEINPNTNTVNNSFPIPYIASSINYNQFNNTLWINSTSNNSVQSFASPIPILPYINGSTYTYNQFNEDKKYQPFLLYCMMMYSKTIGNLNQVFDATVRDANGQIAKDPKFPALQISMYQFQGSVAKVCFGKKGRGGFILDQESSFTNFTVQPQSSVTLVLIQKQLKLGKNFSKPITLCEKLDPSVNPKLKIAPPKKKELPKGKPKPKDKKPLASKPIKSFFQEICSRMDGEQEILQDSVNNAMSNFQLKINNSEVEEDKSVNLGVPLVIIGGIAVAFAFTK